MIYFIIFFAAFSSSFAATWKETRNVTDSLGNQFECVYKISHDGETVNDAKSSVSCKPNMDGSPVTENIYILDLGKYVAVSHEINKKGKDSIMCILENSTPPDLNGDHAMEIIKLVMDTAARNMTAVTICVRDRHDNLVAHFKMKNAWLGTVDLACQKARSSALFPAPSNFGAAFPGIALSNGIVSIVQGGLPLITASGMWVGSVGVSGAMSGELDEEIAQVAVDNIDAILASQTFPLTQQATPTQDNSCTPDLNGDHAMEMIRLVSESASQQMVPVVICIRDKGDNLVAHIRMTNAIIGSVDLACQKARSSALFPIPSGTLAIIPGIEMSNGIISPVGGALPLITETGMWVGSIGVSGAPSGELDEALAKIAVDNLADILENF